MMLNLQSVAQPGGLASVNQTFPVRLQYSRPEAANLLGVSLRTLDRLIAEKQIPVRHIGRRVLITHDALTQFIKRDHQTQIQ